MSNVLYLSTYYNPQENNRVWGCAVVDTGTHADAQFVSAWGPAGVYAKIQHKWQPVEASNYASARYYAEVSRKEAKGYVTTLAQPGHFVTGHLYEVLSNLVAGKVLSNLVAGKVNVITPTTTSTSIQWTTLEINGGQDSGQGGCAFCGCAFCIAWTTLALASPKRQAFFNQRCGNCNRVLGAHSSMHPHTILTASTCSGAVMVERPSPRPTPMKRALLPDLNCSCEHWLHEHDAHVEGAPRIGACLIGDCGCERYRHVCAECGSISLNYPVHKDGCVSGIKPEAVRLKLSKPKEERPAQTRLPRRISHLIVDV